MTDRRLAVRSLLDLDSILERTPQRERLTTACSGRRCAPPLTLGVRPHKKPVGQER